MLSRPVATPLSMSPAPAVVAWQVASLISALLGPLALALSQAPLAPLPGQVGGGLGMLGGSISPSQGLVAQGHVWPLGSLLNPHADIDSAASTDGEDIAAPVADIAEFRSKDAFLAVDALWGGALAANLGVAGVSAALSTALVQDCI